MSKRYPINYCGLTHPRGSENRECMCVGPANCELDTRIDLNPAARKRGRKAMKENIYAICCITLTTLFVLTGVAWMADGMWLGDTDAAQARDGMLMAAIGFWTNHGLRAQNEKKE